jgi:hypothetical protein
MINTREAGDEEERIEQILFHHPPNAVHALSLLAAAHIHIHSIRRRRKFE